jgi:ATP-binding cassette subfamily B protein
MDFTETKKNFKLLARTFAREISLIFKFHPLQASAMAVTQLVTGLVPAGVLFVTAKIITVVARQPGFWTKSLLNYVLILLALLLIQRTAFLFHDYFMNRLQNLLFLSVNDRVHRKIASLDLMTLEKPEIQTMITLFRDQAWRPYNMVRTVFDFFSNFFASLSFVIIAWSFSPLIISVFLLALIPSMVVSVKSILSSYHLNWSKGSYIKQTWYLQSLFLGVASITELLVHGATGKIADRYHSLYSLVVEKEKQIERKKLVASAITNLFAFGVYIWAFASIVTEAIVGAFTIGDFTLFAGAFVNVERFLVSQVWQIVSLFEHTTYLEKFQELEDLKPGIVDLPNAEILPAVPLKIEFKNVSFSYPGSKNLALDKVSFVLNFGERLALVGENGAGKTTLVKLLLRLYEPTSGEILVNGKNIRSYTLESLRLRIAVTFQDFLKLALSAKENIGLGLGVSEAGDSRIVEAAVRSGAHEKIISLPKGYDTCLGRGWEDDGVELSGGEWQKVALARSLIKNASLIVLDEPTAALDARSEFKFFQELFRREREVSLFLISHRFSSVRVADRILVLENGRLVEEGKHEDLMNKKGLYFELYELQTREIS